MKTWECVAQLVLIPFDQAGQTGHCRAAEEDLLAGRLDVGTGDLQAAGVQRLDQL
ncbi:hypothetical protein OG741_00465 [Streptomyces sp. NBC_01410]|uniref:hypothetical protein n=1 Tax=Streptomyces sp. NBC_01410 TaxID=2903856 RepID=UPI0032450CDC